MLATLSTVAGAVSTRDLLPILTHFCFYPGSKCTRMQGGDGRVAIDSPCPEVGQLNVTVPAEKFIKAVEGCGGEPKLELDGDKLRVKKGRFRVSIPTLKSDDYPRVFCPDAQVLKVPANLVGVLRQIREFVSTDASKVWATGVQIRDGFAAATNNVAIVRMPLEWDAEVNIPTALLDELIRLGQPAGYSIVGNHLTFYYNTGVWLWGATLIEQFPDLARFFSGERNLSPCPEGLLHAIDLIAPFFPDDIGTVLFENGEVKTVEGEHSAAVDGFQLTDGAYSYKVIKTVLSVATHIDFSPFPSPIPFDGANGLQGVFVGVRR